jgi:hypothetical protein
MKLYFNPECFQIINDSGLTTSVVAMKQQEGVYKIQLLNLDNQLGTMVNVSIDDRITQSLFKNSTLVSKRRT